MDAGIAEDATEEHRGAVRDRGLAGERRVRRDERGDLHDLGDLVERAEHSAGRSETVERALAREILGLFRRNLSTHLAGLRQRTLYERKLTARVDEVATAQCRHIRGHWGCDLGNFVAQLAQAFFDD